MFSQACVKNSVHSGEGGCIPACTGQGVSAQGGVCPGEGGLPRKGLPRGVSAQGGVCPGGGWTPPNQRQTPHPRQTPPRDDHYRERYTSYWNAFLLELAPTSHDDCGYCLLLHHVSSPSVSSTTAATQRYHNYYDHPASTKTQFKTEDGYMYQTGKNWIYCNQWK